MIFREREREREESLEFCVILHNIPLAKLGINLFFLVLYWKCDN